jgi:hypothetical protein
MDWVDAPPTWKQLKYLRQLGYTPDHRLTKTEAAELIVKLGGKPENGAPVVQPSQPSLSEEAHQLRTAVETAKQSLEGFGMADERRRQAFAKAMARRQEFWVDTCREVNEMHSRSRPLVELYRKHGCLYHTPTPRQVQDILDALDSAMPAWEKEHTELFFETLGLNFPELVRHR